MIDKNDELIEILELYGAIVSTNSNSPKGVFYIEDGIKKEFDLNDCSLLDKHHVSDD